MDTEILELYNISMSYHLATVFLGFAMILILIAVFHSIFRMRRSQEYRKLLSDLYVAGKITKIAKEDGIDLVEEEVNFKRWCKKQDLKYLDLDRTIEAKLKDKIEEEKVKDIKKSEIKKSLDKK